MKDIYIIKSPRELENLMSGKRVQGRNNSSERHDYEWTGTHSLEHSEELRKYGDKESYDKLANSKAVTDKFIDGEMGVKTKFKADLHGFAPIVPNAIIGLPLSMIDSERQPKKVKLIDIVINVSIACSVDAKDIIERGAMILSFIDSLEKQGYRIKLYIADVYIKGYGGEKANGIIIPIKNHMEQLNMYKLAYYIVNPSCLRRTFFKLQESIPELPDVTNDGYGRNKWFDTQQKAIKKALKNDKVVIIDGEVKPTTDREKNYENLLKVFNNAKVLDWQLHFQMGWIITKIFQLIWKKF